MGRLPGGAGDYFRKLRRCILPMVFCGIFGAPRLLHAEPWRIATFTLSEETATTCENCLPEWKAKIDTVFNRDYPMNPGVVTGYIVLIDLTDSKLQFMMRKRDPLGACAHYRGPAAYAKSERPEPLPIQLMTVPEWAHEVGAEIAFSGPFFRYDKNVGVRAKSGEVACGELTGLQLQNGVVEWPPKDKPALLREPIDSDVDFKADVILFYGDRTAAIRSIDSFDDAYLQKASYGLSGIRLYVGDDVNPTPGTKPLVRMARMGLVSCPATRRLSL